MKSSSVFLAVATLASLTGAIPFQKRDMVMVTKTQLVRTTVEVVKTVWAEPNSSPTAVPKVQPQAEPTPAAQGTPKPPKLANNPMPPAPQPAPTTVAAPSAPPAPVNTPHSNPKPPSPPPPPPAPAPSPAQPPSGGSGQSFSGDGTYYHVGLGSCGLESTPNEMVVALAEAKMMETSTANPNDNPVCGKTISITYKGVTQTAKVVDTCPGCSGIGDLDMSRGLFQKFAPFSEGRIYNVQWHFV